MILYFNNKLLHDQVCLIDYVISVIKKQIQNALCAVDLNKRLMPSYKLFYTIASMKAEIMVQVTNLRHCFKNTITLIAYI